MLHNLCAGGRSSRWLVSGRDILVNTISHQHGSASGNGEPSVTGSFQEVAKKPFIGNIRVSEHAFGKSDDSKIPSEMTLEFLFHLGEPLLAAMQKNSNGGGSFETTVKTYFLV